jgi:ABC-type lipoprotein export system ATPase subunit
MIRLQDITKSYSVNKQETRHALDRVSVTVESGDFLAIVGPSGSGKSTLLAIAGLLDAPTEGTVWIEGQDASRWSDSKRAEYRAQQCGFVFQFPSLIPTLNVMENVLLPKTMIGTFRPEDRRQAEQILEEVGLTAHRNSFPSQLSGGEQRRAALARALIQDPKILLADEPTGALDDRNAELIMGLLKGWNQRGKTILLVTHDRRLAKAGNRILRLMDGRTDESGEDDGHVF